MFIHQWFQTGLVCLALGTSKMVRMFAWHVGFLRLFLLLWFLKSRFSMTVLFLALLFLFESKLHGIGAFLKSPKIQTNIHSTPICTLTELPSNNKMTKPNSSPTSAAFWRLDLEKWLNDPQVLFFHLPKPVKTWPRKRNENFSSIPSAKKHLSSLKIFFTM